MRIYRTKATRMRKVVAFSLTGALLLQSAVVVVAQNATTGVFSQSTVPCPSDSTIRGYTTVAAMNTDMRAELSLIRRGSASREPYVFVLCPDTTFDMTSEALRPLLSGSVFTCGTMGNPASNCDLSGGTNQVVIDDPMNVTGYRLSMISFVGVTFTGFENSAISGNASDTTTVDLTRSNFEAFDSMFAVLQQKGNGDKPFNMQVFNSSITGAEGGTVFANIGGELTLEDVRVDSSTLMSLSSTGSSTGSVGATFVRGVEVANSDVMDIFVALEGADLDAMDVNVNNMNNMLNIFDIAGEGSTATIDGLVVESNDLSGVNPPVRWTGVNIRDDASGTASNSAFTDNTNVRHVFSASSSSSLDIQGAMVTSTTGGRAVDERDVSSIVFANIQSTVTATDVQMEETDEFTAAIFSNAASAINVATSCLGPGAGQGAVYVSEDSTYTTTDNFIDPAYASSVCTEPGARLIQEQAGSGCFQANRTDCAFDCVAFFDAETCLAQVETEAPSLAPSPRTNITNVTMAPIPPRPNVTTTRAPTMRPITSAPVTSAPVVVPSAAPSASPSRAPSEVPSAIPSLAPQNVTLPTLRPTRRPTTLAPKTAAPIAAPTSKPSSLCDCSGKGKKKKGKGKGKGKGKRRVLKGDDDYDDDLQFDDDDSDEEYDDDNQDCECPGHKKSKKGKGGKGKGGKGKGGKGKGGKGGEKGKGLSAWERGGSQTNFALHHLGDY